VAMALIAPSASMYLTSRGQRQIKTFLLVAMMLQQGELA